MIIQESLTDQSILEPFKIIKTESTSRDDADGGWNILTVEGPIEAIHNLAAFIKVGTWYAHFWNRNELIIVFKDKVITDRQKAVAYGRSIGIPEQQLDFPTT